MLLTSKVDKLKEYCGNPLSWNVTCLGAGICTLLWLNPALNRYILYFYFGGSRDPIFHSPIITSSKWLHSSHTQFHLTSHFLRVDKLKICNEFGFELRYGSASVGKAPFTVGRECRESFTWESVRWCRNSPPPGVYSWYAMWQICSRMWSINAALV